VVWLALRGARTLGGGGELRLPPRRVDGSRSALVQHAHPDGTLRIVETHSQEAVFAVKNDGDIPGTAVSFLAGDGAFIHPGVSLTDGDFGGRRYPQRQARRLQGWRLCKCDKIISRQLGNLSQINQSAEGGDWHKINN
jgi:hypothetical protein